MRWTRAEIARVLRERGIRPKRHLGQSFLVDANFLDAIVRAAEIGPRDGVVEIGSGLGNLTERLAERAGHVWAFEIDPPLFELSVETLRDRPNVTLINLDGAEFAGHIDPGVYSPLKVVSNLPYSDYYRIVLRLMSTTLPVESFYLMLQGDVVDRLGAGPGEGRYGPISVIVGGLFEMKVLRRAGRALFYPAPRVESVFFRLRRRGDAAFMCEPAQIPRLERGLRALFANRRKQLRAVGRRLGIPLAERYPALAERRMESLPPATLLEMTAWVSDARNRVKEPPKTS
ncbi:MAG: 16S rRNA (adenine(1518)-N(6)/adenine(1519)-N(6))-dimethyltransferase [Planctomycetes bacterium]|nr:16S rRNA (adenine(1518)-N(6)/adenine(1519)-N(6))-dimethyltransferase [Planctomycetota bacterium]